MLGRLAPQTDEERAAVEVAGLHTTRILSAHDMISSDEVFFAATGITTGMLLPGVRYRGNSADRESLVLRCETGACRFIRAEHVIG